MFDALLVNTYFVQLFSGAESVLIALLAVRQIMIDGGAYRYIFNDLYLTDYIIWIQTLRFIQVFIRISKSHWMALKRA